MIDKFQGEYRWLSNFWSIPIEYEGIVYPSTEHAYQAAKTEDVELRKKIAAAPTFGNAKRMGGELELRVGWDEMRLEVMEEVLWKKFEDPQLRKRLIDTYDHRLVEGNTWGDTFWGVCNGKGKNHLGDLLMKIRDYYCGICDDSSDGSHCVHWWDKEPCCYCEKGLND